MRVSYRAVASVAEAAVYEQAGPVKFCRVEMCRRWGVLVGVGVNGHPRSTSREVNLHVPRPQASGGAVLELVPIDYYPFCGEPVETVRVK